MLKNNNHTYATPGFQGFLNSCLHDIYAGTGIKVKPETIKYAMYDDCDYAVIYETMQFTMGDGRSWEIYYEPKGRKNFTEIANKIGQ